MKLFRLWAIVLSANFVGTFIAALFLWLPAFAQPGITEALSELSAHIMSVGAIDNIYRGIPAGILIAAIVWMIPMSRGFSFSPSSLLPTSSLSVGFPMLLSVPVKRRMMCLWETRQLRIISLNSSFLQA